MTSRWLVVFVIACGSGKSDRTREQAGGSAAQGSSHVVQLPAPEVALPRELAFELLESGRGEREVLRYAPVAGTTHAVVRTRLTTRELADGTWGPPSALPAIITPLDVEVAPDGGTRWRPLAGSIDGADSPAARGYVAVWQRLANQTFAIPLDARGRLGALSAHDASSDELVQRLLATIVPLPEQPVGEGARWRVVTALRQQGAVLKQTATYTLVSAGPTWRIAADIQRLAEAQRVGDVELVAIVRRLSGTLAIDPAQLVPASGALAVKSTVHVRSGSRENIIEDTGEVELHVGTDRTSSTP